jgi:hypothetical protein
MANNTLAQRMSQPLAVSSKSAWGTRAEDFNIKALRGRAPIASTILDFGVIPVPSVTALGASPLNFTVTNVGVPGGTNAISANSNDGYLKIIPGTTNATGYNIQGVKTDNPNIYHMKNTAGIGGVNISGQDKQVFFGIRCAFHSTSTWNGAIFMGFGIVDTAYMTPGTGALDGITNCHGVHIDTSGNINLVSMRSSTLTSVSFPFTMSRIGTVSSTVKFDQFHDIFFRSVFSGGGDSGNSLECFFDGESVAVFKGSMGGWTSNQILTNTIEIITDPANAGTDCAMAISHLVNGTTRGHLMVG